MEERLVNVADNHILRIYGYMYFHTLLRTLIYLSCQTGIFKLDIIKVRSNFDLNFEDITNSNENNCIVYSHV